MLHDENHGAAPPAASVVDASAAPIHSPLPARDGHWTVAPVETAAGAKPADPGETSRPTIQFGGLIQIDAVWFGQDAQSRAAVGDIQDVFDFRRARLIAQGQAADVFNYGMGIDFALGTPGVGRPQFLDVYMGIVDLPYVGNARVGHFFEPFSLDRLTLIRFHTYLERSLADTFAPARNLGIMLFDQFAEEGGTWAIGTFRSGSDTFGDDVGDQEGQTVTGRLTWLPWYDEPSEGRAYLHLGGAYSFRDAADGLLRFRSRPEIAGRSDTEGISVPFFVDTGKMAADYGQLLGFEGLWVRGPVSLQGEYIFAPVNRDGSPDASFHGAYLSASYFLTGEHRPYNRQSGAPTRVIPFENFFRVRTDSGDIATGRGAWELAVRLSHIDLTDAGIAGGKLTDGTLGLNWYLTPYHRLRWNLIHAHLDKPPLGESNAVIFAMRFDADF